MAIADISIAAKVARFSRGCHAQLRKCVDDQPQADNDIGQSPYHDVTQAGDKLRIDRFGQHKIKSAIANLLDHGAYIWTQERFHQTGEKSEKANNHQHFGIAPFPHLLAVQKEDGNTDYCPHEPKGTHEGVREKIHTVFELLENRIAIKDGQEF
jgi:hypothetical protein